MKYFIRNIVILLTTLILFIQCEDDITETPPYITIDILKAAPDSLLIEDKVIKLSTYMAVDMMPSTDPNPDRNYMVITYIKTIDSTDFPSSVDAESVYIIYNNEVLNAYLEHSEYPHDTFKIVKNAKIEPKWGYDIYPDVVVSITFKNKTYLLRADNQYIGSVW